MTARTLISSDAPPPAVMTAVEPIPASVRLRMLSTSTEPPPPTKPPPMAPAMPSTCRSSIAQTRTEWPAVTSPSMLAVVPSLGGVPRALAVRPVVGAAPRCRRRRRRSRPETRSLVFSSPSIMTHSPGFASGLAPIVVACTLARYLWPLKVTYEFASSMSYEVAGFQAAKVRVLVVPPSASL